MHGCHGSASLLRYQGSFYPSAPPCLASILSLLHSPIVAADASAITSAFQARGRKRGRKAKRAFPESLTQQCLPSSDWPLSLVLMVLIPEHEEIFIYLQQNDTNKKKI